MKSYPLGIPIEYSGTHSLDNGTTVGFSSARFRESWGPWTKGDEFWLVQIDLLAGTVSAWAWTADKKLFRDTEVAVQLKAV